MALFDIIRNAMMAGFGVQEKVKEFVDELVKKGELSESQGAKLVKEWSDKFDRNTQDISKGIGDAVTKAMEKMNLSTRDDLTRINEKIDALAARVGRMEGSKGENQ